MRSCSSNGSIQGYKIVVGIDQNCPKEIKGWEKVAGEALSFYSLDSVG